MGCPRNVAAVMVTMALLAGSLGPAIAGPIQVAAKKSASDGGPLASHQAIYDLSLT